MYYLMRLRLAVATAALTLAVVSCVGVKPPERPVAYMYPMLVKMSEIADCKPTIASPDNVKSLLAQAHLLEPLMAAGLRNVDLGILARGLAKHGYAEIDARRAACPVRWASIAFRAGAAIIRSGFKELPPDECRFGIKPDDSSARQTIERGSYGQSIYVKTWSIPGTRAFLKKLASPHNDSRHWEIIVTLPLEKNMSIINIPAWYYQQFDADTSLPVPAEAFGGWKREPNMPFDIKHSALIIMHAWYTGKPGQFPGLEHLVEYIPRANKILDEVFPTLIATARRAGLPIIHVAAGNYYQNRPEYLESVRLAGPESSPEQITRDDTVKRYAAFRTAHSNPGLHNQKDIAESLKVRDFAPQVAPLPGEPIVATEQQLFAHCKRLNVTHLVYTGFAINACLQCSPCCMLDMSRRGLFCSAIRQATTAVEFKETAVTETAKNIQLNEVALFFGFVYDVDDFTTALNTARN